MSSILGASGLVSGLPIQELVESLIDIQRRPIRLMQGRVAELTRRRTAFVGLSAQLLSIRNVSLRFQDSSFFRKAAATSTNESAIVATALTGAPEGRYTLTVRQLATAYQTISTGFATADATPIGAGTLTIETAAGRVDRSTPLGALNGGAGVRAGTIRITDRDGDTADIDLTTAATIQDVLDSINGQTEVRVVARIDGDRLVLEDQTGGTGTLTVAEVAGGRTAADLGLAGSSASGEITGRDLVFLSTDTRLGSLNDGNGVRLAAGQAVADFRIALSDGTSFDVDLSEQLADGTPLDLLNGGTGVPAGSIRITNRAGSSFDIDLSGAATIGDVKAAIEAADSSLTVSLRGPSLRITDSSTGEDDTVIEELGGGTTARALGLVGSSTTGEITGEAILRIQTLGDVIRIINGHPNNNGGVVAGISSSGDGITLTDISIPTGTPFSITAIGGSQVAEDLGLLGSTTGSEIDSRRLIAGLDTVLLRSLNGGSGVETGVIELTNRLGATVQVDLSSAETLADVVSAINAQSGTSNVTASISSSGLGIELTDASGGAGNLAVADVIGRTAADLGLARSVSRSTLASGNLQRQYISGASVLADLNLGRGVPAGRFRITDSSGASAVVDLTQGNETTLQHVIDEINSRPVGIVATINATGDGLLLTDQTGGSGRLRVTEEGSTVAAALGILGQAAAGETTIDGSLETRIEVDAGDTLSDVLNRLRASSARVEATIINDGSSARPFRLSLTSSSTGRDGQLAIDVGQTGLAFEDLVRGRDAAVLFGSPGAGSPLVLTSSTNTLTDVIEGVRLDLINADDEPVTIAVSRDLDTVVEDLANFVAAFNTAISSIDDATSFDLETETRGVLLGDTTVSRVRRRLFDMTTRIVPDLSPPFNRLSAVGITSVRGARLEFDEAKFREVYEQNSEAVEDLFASDEFGFGDVIAEQIDQLTDSEDGLISLRQQALRASEDVLEERIEQLETLLDRRRERLFADFNAAELALSRLQQQQSALLALTSNLSL